MQFKTFKPRTPSPSPLGEVKRLQNQIMHPESDIQMCSHHIRRSMGLADVVPTHVHMLHFTCLYYIAHPSLIRNGRHTKGMKTLHYLFISPFTLQVTLVTIVVMRQH